MSTSSRRTTLAIHTLAGIWSTRRMSECVLSTRSEFDDEVNPNMPGPPRLASTTSSTPTIIGNGSGPSFQTNRDFGAKSWKSLAFSYLRGRETSTRWFRETLQSQGLRMQQQGLPPSKRENGAAQELRLPSHRRSCTTSQTAPTPPTGVESLFVQHFKQGLVKGSDGTFVAHATTRGSISARNVCPPTMGPALARGPPRLPVCRGPREEAKARRERDGGPSSEGNSPGEQASKDLAQNAGWIRARRK